MKIKKLQHGNGRIQYLHNCPGCGYEHAFSLKSQGGHHDFFNEDFDKPTIRPSLLQNFSPDRVCHSHVIDGQIQFLNDCWHKLKGQTVELPDYESQ